MVNPQPGRHLHITSRPGVAGGEPCIALKGVRVTDLLDRIDAGDSIEEVAKDFGCDRGSLELLVELRSILRGREAATVHPKGDSRGDSR